jgi:tetratricopeptide (TPR) repeat protein
MVKANEAALAGKDQATVGTNLSQAIESGRKAVQIAENKASNNEALALIYENASFYTRGALEWSEQLYKKVIELDPLNPVPSLRIALVNMARANAEQDPEEKAYYIGEAIKKYDEAIAKKGDLAAAYYGKAIAYERLGNSDDAIEELRQASLVARNNLDYRFELGRMYFNRGVTQPNLDQTAAQQIAEDDITPGGGTSTAEQISVQPTQATGGVVTKNADLVAAEQLFLSILLANANHANASYSLAVLYQKVGETDNARTMAENLLNILADEATKETVRQQFADILE